MKPEVAFVADAMPGLGGGERVILHALELFPDAPIFTPFYAPEAFRGTRIASHRVITPLTGSLPLLKAHYRSLLPLMMLAVRQFDLSAYDLVISFNYAVAHAVRTQPGQRHVSYTHTPMRYAWRGYPLSCLPHPAQAMLERFFRYFRQWDTRAVAGVSAFAAASKDISGWIRRAYQRESQVIYPPVELERFHPCLRREDYFITVSRLVAHKHIDLIVETFTRLKLPLIVVGEGPELPRLRQIAGATISFTGYQPDAEVARLLNSARAYVSAAEEDFGIAIVEAQAAGCPVISYRKGGAQETVVDGCTGVFFNDRTTESLGCAVETFDRARAAFNPIVVAENAQRFSTDRFIIEFAQFASIRN